MTISLLKLMMRPKSLYEKMICSKHFNQVHFFSWIEEESGVFDTLVHTNLTFKTPSSDTLIDIAVFL